MSKKAKVVITEQEEIGADVIASAIISMSKSMEALSNSKLKREAIVTLIKDRSGIPKVTIEVVLNNLEQLKETWIKK